MSHDSWLFIKAIGLVISSIFGIAVFSLLFEWCVDAMFELIGELYVRIFKRNSR